MYLNTGNFEKAEPYLLEALDLRRRLFPEPSMALVYTIEGLGVLSQNLGDMIGAADWFRQALTIRQALSPAGDVGVAGAANGLARALYHTGDFATAEPLFRECLSIRRRVLAPNDANLASAINDVAKCLVKLGRYEEAVEHYDKALTIYAADLRIGAHHPYTAVARTNLAAALRILGRYERAEKLLDRAVSDLRVSVGEAHPYMAKALLGLAFLDVARGACASATARWRQALEMLSNSRSSNHPASASAKHNLAATLRRCEGKERWTRRKHCCARRWPFVRTRTRATSTTHTPSWVI